MILIKINQHIFLFETKDYAVIKQHIKNLYLENLLTSRISTLCSGCYTQVVKSVGHHLCGCWSRCTGDCYIERSLN